MLANNKIEPYKIKEMNILAAHCLKKYGKQADDYSIKIPVNAKDLDNNRSMLYQRLSTRDL